MSEPTTPTPTETPAATDPATAVPTPPAGDPPKAEDAPLGEGGEKALRAEREARKAAEKLAADHAARIKEFEDRDKSESDKLNDAKAAAEKSAADANRELLRYKIAADTKVDPNLLAGDDEAAMRAHAEALLTWRGDPKPPVPKSDPSQGARPDGSPDIDQEIAEAVKAGNIQLSIALKQQKQAQASKR